MLEDVEEGNAPERSRPDSGGGYVAAYYPLQPTPDSVCSGMGGRLDEDCAEALSLESGCDVAISAADVSEQSVSRPELFDGRKYDSVAMTEPERGSCNCVTTLVGFRWIRHLRDRSSLEIAMLGRSHAFGDGSHLEVRGRYCLGVIIGHGWSNYSACLAGC